MLLISHRGCLIDHPENTLEGMVDALDEGADGIEFDVGRSLDGVWYLLHDTSVDRTTEGSGGIKNLTSAYLDSLWIAGGEGYRPQDHGTRYRLPRLLDVLDEVEPYMGRVLMFHVKPATAQAFTEIAQLIVARDLLDRAYLLADSGTYLPNVKAVNPAIKTIYAGKVLPAGADSPLLSHAVVDYTTDVSGYAEWDMYIPVGDPGELGSIGRALQWGARHGLVNDLHSALAHQFSETYAMPDSVKVLPAGSVPGGVVKSNVAGDAYIMSMTLPSMTVRGLCIRAYAANSGHVKWGLFDAAGAKVAGGQGPIIPGWPTIDATAPVDIAGGAYSLVVAQPASAAPTIYILDTGGSTLCWRALSYTWVDTLDPTDFTITSVGPVTCFLYGDPT